MAWHGSLPYATDANQWVDNKQNGAHIGKTPDYEKAGNFSFTKWPCGKYCLAGFNQGLSQACPDVSPGISFDNKATDSCIELELLEVPCDTRADKNNCIWKIARTNAVARSTVLPRKKPRKVRSPIARHKMARLASSMGLNLTLFVGRHIAQKRT